MGSSTNNIEDIFIKNIVNRKVKLEPIHIHKDYKDELNKKLVKELDGKYSKYGFIKEGSINIIKCSLGELEQNSLQGNVLFNVQFSILVCNPVIGNIIKCKVHEQNNFGLLCKDVKHSVIHIIVPKKTIKIKSDIPLNNISNDDIVFIEIVGKKPILNNKKIDCIGRIIRTNKIKNVNENTENDNTILVEGDDDFNEIVGDLSDTDSSDSDIQDGGDISDAESLLSVSDLSDNISELSDSGISIIGSDLSDNGLNENELSDNEISEK